MPFVHARPPWFLPERLATPESVHASRRRFLAGLGTGLLGLAAAPLAGCRDEELERFAAPPGPAFPPPRPGYPARPNPAFGARGLAVTPPHVATTHNNFYEFSTDQERVHRLVGRFRIEPWTVEITGLVARPGRYTVEDLEALVPLEERVYRFRCVEAWAMVLPWTGLPLAALCRKLGVRGEARYLRFTSFHAPDQAPGFTQLGHYPWPYFETLRIDEALNELSLLATGLYGKPLPKQNGAPVRLVVPWKYGLKNIKSIVRIEFRATRSGSFWHSLQPSEYSWLSNVDPAVPHPRWSQARERDLATGETRPTLPFNGYGRYVASLYG